MKFSYLLLLVGLSLFVTSCSSDYENNLDYDDTDLELRKDEAPKEGCNNCRVFLSVGKDCKLKVTLTKGCIGKVSYQWSTPYGTVNTPNPPANVNGNYCVNIFTSQGCWASACTNIKDCKDDCDNDCVEVGFSNVGKCKLEVNLNECDSPPKNIIWTTPLNYIPFGPTVSADVDGVYCAHVSFADGCQYTDCINIKDCQEFCEDDCAIEFEINNAGTDCYMDVISMGCSKPLEIEWTYPNGSTTDYHRISIAEDGTYCVMITQPNGCEVSDCIDIVGCDEDTPVDCDDFDLVSVDFQNGLPMCRDVGFGDFDNSVNYPGDVPVAYIAGQSFKVSAAFYTECEDDFSVYIRGIHDRDGTEVEFPPQEIFTNNGSLIYDWDNPEVNGVEFEFPELTVEFHDPFEILWQFSLDGSSGSWTDIQTSFNPVYVTRSLPQNYVSAAGLCPQLKLHTYFRKGCEAAHGLSAMNEIADKIFEEVFSSTDFSTASGAPLHYYNSWITSEVCTDNMITQASSGMIGDAQCTAHTEAFLKCLRMQGIGEGQWFSIFPTLSTGEGVGLLVNEFASTTTTPFAHWANGAPWHPADFTIENVVIPKQDAQGNLGGASYGAVANDFAGNTLYSEIDDINGFMGQNNDNPKSYFHNHQIAVGFGKFYDLAYGTANTDLGAMLSSNLYGFIYRTQADINEQSLGIEIGGDPNVLESSVNVWVWLIDTSPNNLSF